MKNKILSIFILTPGSIKRTRFVLDSLLNQTYKNFEVIVGTDGLRKNTEKAILPYKNLLAIKHVWLKDSSEFQLASIYNKCVRNAKGKYILCLNHDTLIPPNGVEILLKNIKRFGSKYFISPLRKEIEIKNINKNTIKNHFNKIEQNSRQLFHGNMIRYCEPDSGGIIPKDKILKINGQFDIITGISNVGEYKIRLRNEAGIKQKNIDQVSIIHIAHQQRAYLGNKYIFTFFLRYLAKREVPRAYIIKYLQNNPDIKKELINKTKRFAKNNRYHYDNMNDCARAAANEIALEYYKNQCKN